MSILSNLKPERLWYFFEKLCEIPRPSKHEEAVVNYIEEFAKKAKLEYSRDSVGNVVIRKPAHAEMKGKPGVVLQSHVDMVPQKNNDKKHDFLKDPIIPVIDGEWVRADNTTLGSDNGIGVAAMLAILEDNTLKHGPLEALFTIDEETGMTGAFHLSEKFISGRKLFNLDSEEDGEICIGCAGGLDANAKFHYIEEPVPENSEGYQIIVKGLVGGHSGVDIHRGRGNAIKILCRILWHATKNYGLQLSAIEGGSLRNAIPREAKAVFTLHKNNLSDFKKFLHEQTILIKNEYIQSDPGLKIEFHEEDRPFTVLNDSTQHDLLNAIYACPNGVIRMSQEVPGVVETSTNLACIRMKDGEVIVQCLLRSAVDSSKQNLANMIDSVFTLAGADVSFDGSYPGWKPNRQAGILQAAIYVFKKENGKEPEIKVIHAGLECGIIGAKYPGMEMISFGPTITGAHSPDEKVNIKAVQNFWKILLHMLENIT